MSYKIAVVTEDGKRISSHFGMAPRYKVFTVDENRIVAEEDREKPHHKRHPDHGTNHGSDHDHSHSPGHTDMFAPLEDCRVLLAGGMGSPAHRKALEVGLEVVLTGGEIRPAVEAYLREELPSDLRRVHQH